MSEAAATEQVEQVEDATTQQPEKPNVVPEATFLKEKSKWKEKLQKEQESAEQYAQRLRALEIENELLRKNNAPKIQGPPSELDFDDPAEYRQAMDQYIAEQTKKQLDQYSQSQAEKIEAEKRSQKLEGAMDEHYKRAAALGADDFSASENKAREILGDESCQQIMLKFDNSEQVLYTLGKNPDKAQEIANEIRTDPVGAIIQLTRYAHSLSDLKPESIPEPDSRIEGSAASPSVNWDQKIEDMRKQVRAKKASMQDVINLKAEARAAGWKE